MVARNTTVAIADDHEPLRRYIRNILDEEQGISIVGEAGSGYETLSMVDKLEPEILVLDLALGDMNGFEVISRLTEKFPETNVIMFSVYSSLSYLRKAYRTGAKGYITKKNPHELLTAIHKVANGENFFSIDGHIDPFEL